MLFYTHSYLLRPRWKRTRHSLIDSAIRLWFGNLRKGGSTPGKEMLLFSKVSRSVLGHKNPPARWTSGLLPQVLITPIHLVPKLRINGAIPPHPHMSSWRVAGTDMTHPKVSPHSFYVSSFPLPPFYKLNSTVHSWGHFICSKTTVKLSQRKVYGFQGRKKKKDTHCDYFLMTTYE